MYNREKQVLTFGCGWLLLVLLANAALLAAAVWIVKYIWTH